MTTTKTKTEEVLMRIESEDDVRLMPPGDDKPHYALQISGTVISGRLEGENLKFWAKWGSAGEQKRMQSACVAMGMDPEATLDDPSGLGTTRLVNAVVRPNDRTGEPEIWFFKPVQSESEYI